MSLDVCLVSMPYAAVERPSIALSLVQSALRGAGHSARVVYGNLAFAEQVGLPIHQTLCQLGPEKLLGEWTFAAAAFPEMARSPGDIARLVAEVDEGGRHSARLGGPSLFDWVLELRRFAPQFIDHMARVVLSTSPRIVGVTSSFQQHCAALALLRRLRELAPEVMTMIGGANCEGTMGQVLVRNFPWVDVVVSGEADELVVPLVRSLLENGRRFDAAELPSGVITATHRSRGDAPRAVVNDMDGLTIPDYDDYFLALAASPLGPAIQPALLMETSRGCWWGQIRHCTFCGLNGTSLGYRSKSGQRTLEEMDALAGRYGVRRFEMVDNILDLTFFESVLPALRRRGAPYSMFYETKANLKRNQVELLGSSGVTAIQPGIESLHGQALAEVQKGCSVMHNVQLMKWSREHGVSLSWSLLTGMPGESDTWWEETAEWLDLVEHLEPPSGVSQIHFQRFSPYHFRAADFGLDLAPSRVYRHLFPLPDEELEDLAYYFEDRGDAVPAPARGRRALRRAVDRWHAAWTPQPGPLPLSPAATPPRLEASGGADGLVILDTRRCAVKRLHHLGVLESEIYLACDCARSPAGLVRSLKTRGHDVDEAGVERLLASLTERRLVLRYEGRYLALAIGGGPRRGSSRAEDPLRASSTPPSGQATTPPAPYSNTAGAP